MLVDRDVFSAALAKVKPALASGGVVQELSHLWFDKKNIWAYDGGFGIKLDFPTELDCGVPGKVLTDLMATSVLKEAGLEFQDSFLYVKFGRSSSKVVTLETDRKVWPFPGKLPRGAEFTPLDENFIEALRRILFVKASPATRVEEHGVMVQKAKKDLLLYSTDSKTMAEAVVKGAGTNATFEKTLLPRDFAEELVSQAPEGVDLYVLKDCLIAVGDKITFYSNLLDISTADDLGAILGAEVKRQPEPVALPTGLQAALDRAVVLASRSDPIVTVSVKDGVFGLLGDYGLGKLDESLELEGEHPNAKLRVMATLLARALPYVESVSVTERTLVLYGEPGFTYIVASL